VTWALVRANTIGWGSVEIIASLLAGVVLIGIFLAWEHRARSPMLPLALFRDRAFASANAVSFFMYAALFGTLFLMAQFLQIALGYSPLGAGLRLLPWTAAPMVIAPLAGALSERYGNRPFMALGLALQTIGIGWVALIAAPDMGYAQLGPALAIAGVGISMCFPTVANAVMSSVPLAEAGVASGTNSMLRELGGVFGVAVLASVFARQGIYHSPRVFTDGFTGALWVAVGFSALGTLAALFMPAHKRAEQAPVVAQPALALSGEPT
jgi:MFS family permease